MLRHLTYMGRVPWRDCEWPIQFSLESILCICDMFSCARGYTGICACSWKPEVKDGCLYQLLFLLLLLFICVCTCVCFHVLMWMSVHVFCMCARVCICVDTCVYLCAYVYVYMDVYMCLHVYIYVHVYICVYIYVRTCIYTCMYMFVHVYVWKPEVNWVFLQDCPSPLFFKLFLKNLKIYVLF